MSEHKPCPFCGGRPWMRGGADAITKIWWVECRKCRVSQLAFYTEDEAWKHWDTRKEATK